MIRIGINMAFYNSGNVMQSRFSTSDPGLVAVGNELSHQMAGKVWAYNWTAATTTGAYTLYFCINQIINDGLAHNEWDAPNLCGSRAISVINNSPNANADSYASFGTLDVTQNGSFTNFNVCNIDTNTESDAFLYLSNTALFGTGTLTHGSGCNFSFDTSNIVLPLSISLRSGALYRKFVTTPRFGWQDFTVDNNNQLSSGHSVASICPAPGSTEYQNGLNPFTHCIQLTISDGGPNDADGEIDGIVRDPGVVVIPSAAASNSPDCAATVFNNCPLQGGSMHTKFLLLILSLLLAYRLQRRIK